MTDYETFLITQSGSKIYPLRGKSTNEGFTVPISKIIFLEVANFKEISRIYCREELSLISLMLKSTNILSKLALPSD